MQKKIFTKVVTLVLTLLLLLSFFLTGCGGPGNTAQTETTIQESSVASTTTSSSSDSKDAISEYVELTYYTGTPIPNMLNYDNVMGEVNKVLKERINAKLDFKFIENAKFTEKLNIMIAAGDIFDLASIGNFITSFPQQAAKGGFIPVDDLLNEYGKTILSQVPEKYWSAVTYKGKRMGIIDYMVYAQPMGFSFQKGLVDKYKFDINTVQKLKDIEPFLDIIKKNEKNIVPYLPSGQLDARWAGNNDWDTIVGKFVYSIPDNQVKLWYDLPVIQENLRISNEWYKKGYIAKDAALKTDAVAEMKTKKYAVTTDAGVADETGVKSSDLIGVPCVEKIQTYTLISTSGVQLTVTGISKTSKNPERAMMLKDLMSSDKKLFNTMCYGLEGEDYTVKAGAGTDDPVIEAKGGNDMKWAIWHPWIGNLFLQWGSNWNSKETIDQFLKNNDTAKVSPLLGFVFDPEPVKAELAKIDSITKDTDQVLYAGAEPDFDKFVTDIKDKMMAAGAQKVIDEITRQLADWKQANGK